MQRRDYHLLPSSHAEAYWSSEIQFVFTADAWHHFGNTGGSLGNRCFLSLCQMVNSFCDTRGLFPKMALKRIRQGTVASFLTSNISIAREQSAVLPALQYIAL